VRRVLVLIIPLPLLLTKPNSLFAFAQRSRTCLVHLRSLETQVLFGWCCCKFVVLDLVRIYNELGFPRYIYRHLHLGWSKTRPLVIDQLSRLLRSVFLFIIGEYLPRLLGEYIIQIMNVYERNGKNIFMFPFYEGDRRLEWKIPSFTEWKYFYYCTNENIHYCKRTLV
jgi:hypothetical protein